MHAAEHDAELLEAIPSWVSLGTGMMLKAEPVTDGAARLVFFEASNEDVDHQGEVVLQKALSDSADYYLRHGNIDLHHWSILGQRAGIANGAEYEIGRPVAVRVDGRKTFVKAELYQGEGAMAHNAGVVWDSITKMRPAARWYASVGGAVLAKSVRVDPGSRQRVGVIEKVRWNNVALDRNPVNATVPTISTAPLGVFAKALGGFVLAKNEGAAGPALTAGYGTDAAALTGGAALRGGSKGGHVHSYWDFRDRVAGALRRGACGQSASAITDYAARTYGLDRAEAAEWGTRFLRDLRDATTKKGN